MISPTKKPIYVAFCVLPNSITCIRLLFFEMVIFMIHVNIWFILHRSTVIVSKLVNPAGGGPPSHLLHGGGGGHFFAPLVSPKLLDGSGKFKRRSIALSNLSKETKFH